MKVLLAALAAGLLVGAAAFAQEEGSENLVGKPAPDLQTKDWIQGDGRMQVSDFKGEVLLVEAFATWCGPCRGQMPHLSKLKDEFGAKGLNILSITNEPREVVLQYMAQLNTAPVTYTIGTGGGHGNYRTTGIPAAWLVDVDGKVVWQGGPGSLSEKLIEQELKKVKVTDEMKAARAQKSIEFAESLIAEKKLIRAIELLDKVAKDHKGSDAAKKAEERKAALEKDEATKKELAAQRTLEKIVGSADRPKEKLKGKERDSKALLLESFIKKNEKDAPGAVEQANLWIKVIREDWKVVK